MTLEERDDRREQIALRLFTAMISASGVTVSTGDLLAEQQVRTCFAMADTFMAVADSRRTPSNPNEPF